MTEFISLANESTYDMHVQGHILVDTTSFFLADKQGLGWLHEMNIVLYTYTTASVILNGPKK